MTMAVRQFKHNNSDMTCMDSALNSDASCMSYSEMSQVNRYCTQGHEKLIHVCYKN